MECLVFVSHLKANEFRLSLCPVDAVECIHIDVVVSEFVIDQLMGNYSDNFVVDAKVQALWRMGKG